ATIYRSLEQHKASLHLAGIPEVDNEEENFEEYEEPTAVGHGLSGLEKANELKERELKTLDQKAKVESEKIKRATLKEFKRVIAGIREYAQGFKWKHDDVVETRDKLENVIEQAHEALAFDDEVIEENSIVEILNILKEEFSQLVESGSSFSFTFNLAPYKVDLLEFALSIESLDNTEFDPEDYVRQGVWQRFLDIIDTLKEHAGTSIGSEEVVVISKEVEGFKSVVDELPTGLKGEFDSDLDVLDSVSEYLKELAIRIDESIWGSKRFLLPEEITEKINDLIENEVEPENA
ncbi:MAG: hypothetical protein RLP12_13755, partial [Ekhidna sp.]